MNKRSDVDSTALNSLRGMDLLDKPVLNKSTAFTYEERTALGLHGLLPPQVETVQEQVARAYEAYQRKTDDLERHIYLRQLQDANEVLFYRLLLEHVEEMTPIIYTPVVAQACQQFSHIYRRPRGLFVSYPLRDSMRLLLNNRPHRDVDVIVVTDGQRVLGIGDQGTGGLGISIGKLSLYTLIGGIHPTRTLPIVLDVGTNNQQLLNDPLYIGWRHERLDGQPYYEFVDQFVEAIRQEMPDTCLQWEDFATPHARTILDRYRERVLSFNDDIQGTAAVTLAALISAVKVTGKSLKDQRIVFLGAGSASIGVAEFLLGAMVEAGLTAPEARSRMWIVDIHGVLHSGRTDLTPEQAVCAQPLDSMANWFLQLASQEKLIDVQADDSSRASERRFHLEDVVRNVKPTILIGLSTAGGSFTEPIVREMASHVERPIIFPLSNPTANSEAVPADLVRWTEGRALIATGSPFPSVIYQGRTIPVSQCNNVYIFPAIGLGVRASRAVRISDRMVLSAVFKLAEYSPTLKDANAPLFPALKDLRPVAAEMAVAIGMEAIRNGLAPEATEQELRDRVVDCQWTPEY